MDKIIKELGYQIIIRIKKETIYRDVASLIEFASEYYNVVEFNRDSISIRNESDAEIKCIINNIKKYDNVIARVKVLAEEYVIA